MIKVRNDYAKMIVFAIPIENELITILLMLPNAALALKRKTYSMIIKRVEVLSFKEISTVTWLKMNMRACMRGFDMVRKVLLQREC